MGRTAVAAMVSLWVIPISIAVNRMVPGPYMDEIFHIPQAQRYCRGDFKTWDPMITTPPGLYYASLVYIASLFPGMWVLGAAHSLPDLCSVAVLRTTNGVMAVVCGVLLYDLVMHLRPGLSEGKATVYATVMALYPLHWFFSFLYYTDVASLAAVLAMYLACLNKRYWLSALLGAFAILFRQTNVVWMMFVAANGVLNCIEDLTGKDNVQQVHTTLVKENHILGKEKGFSSIGTLSKRRVKSSKKSLTQTNDSGTYHDQGYIDEIWDIVLKLWQQKRKVFISLAPFVLVLMAFASFIIWNGSIVLGAKEAHKVSPHFAQMLYFGLVAAAALAPVHFSRQQAWALCQSFIKKKILSSFQIFMALMTGFIMVHFFSIAHPYLLADNRHYPFYFWRKVIQVHWSTKYLLICVYVYSWFSIVNTLGRAQKRIWVLLLVAATALVLIPAPLIEFRYYTIPFYFLILHSKLNDNLSWLIIGFGYIFVNIFTMGIFLFRPFQWNHEPGIQRFIW